MKNFHCLFILQLLSCAILAQDSYSSLTEKALSLMWEAKDSAAYRTSLSLYETAFERFPDSVDHLGLYKASVLAGELKEMDKAFTYLQAVYEVEEDEYGTPGWAYVVGEYSASEYKNLLDDSRWKKMEAKALERKKRFYEGLASKKEEFLAVKDQVKIKQELSGEKLYRQLQQWRPYLPKLQRNYSISLPVKDTNLTSYFVHLPENYDPARSYPMLIFLHGAVRYNKFADYQTPSVLGGWNRFYTEFADLHELVLVFPSGSKQFNWMVPDDGFFLIPTIVKQIKQSIHIDDNRIFVSGHSNGATGSFSYLMKQPTLFAGFYGFNTYPKVFTGGTFLENIHNRSFINFSTDEDYYYPPAANDTLKVLLEKLGADYQDHRYDGFPHWFPAFDESRAAHQLLFSDLLTRTRNPFPEKLSWEFDDEQYGSIDWLADMKLDTAQNLAEWHLPVNFEINRWLDYNDQDSLVVVKVKKKAFDFPRKSGKVEASYANNAFRIKTSRITSLSIRISPEMVNLNRKVKVFVNGKVYFNKKLTYDKSFLLQSFTENLDRSQLWVNEIQLQLN